MTDEGTRPKPDNSKEYQEHRKHTASCKWCQYDREELMEIQKTLAKAEKIIDELNKDNQDSPMSSFQLGFGMALKKLKQRISEIGGDKNV